MPIFPILLLSASLLQDATTPQGGQTLRTVEGRGVQIYQCTKQEVGYKWVLEAPEAVLYDSLGAPVGSHSAGPVWKWTDGSSVQGTVVKKQDSPSGSIPSLLLSARPASEKHGALSGVTWVRRSDTQGGVAPNAGCDVRHEHSRTRVPYSATYTFYVGGLPQ